jgi:hypothetical protein
VAIQTATTGNLENASNIIIANCRYTAESATPCQNLIEKFTLGKGEKQLTIPKVGTVDMDDLTDGIDIVASKDITLNTKDLTTSEVGGKFILTDKLLRQFNEDVFAMVGRLGGDAMARKKDKDIIALFPALNGGASLGLAASALLLKNAVGCIAYSFAKLYPDPVSVVHHPNAIAALSKDAAAIGATYYAGILPGLSEELLRRFFKIQINGINFFWDANIVPDASEDGIGAIFSKSAMAILESQAMNVERERDASLRAWEIVTVADYGVFEIDDTYGAPMTYDCAALGTTS